MTRYLVAGYGSIGRRHLRNLLELGETDLVLFHTGHTTLPMDEVKVSRLNLIWTRRWSTIRTQ